MTGKRQGGDASASREAAVRPGCAGGRARLGVEWVHVREPAGSVLRPTPAQNSPTEPTDLDLLLLKTRPYIRVSPSKPQRRNRASPFIPGSPFWPTGPVAPLGPARPGLPLSPFMPAGPGGERPSVRGAALLYKGPRALVPNERVALNQQVAPLN